jgi:hypothetical protein
VGADVSKTRLIVIAQEVDLDSNINQVIACAEEVQSGSLDVARAKCILEMARVELRMAQLARTVHRERINHPFFNFSVSGSDLSRLSQAVQELEQNIEAQLQKINAESK